MVYRHANLYAIENPTWEKIHPDCDDKNFVGIEVAYLYRKQEFGPLLMDLGIGTAQRDFKDRKLPEPFLVSAYGLKRDLAEKFYQKLGFEILESPLRGSYRNLDFVPSQLK